MLKFFQASILIVFCLIFTQSIFSQQMPNTFEIREEFSRYTNENLELWNNAQLSMVLFYEGSDIPAAKMYLYDNQILILKSKFYSPTLSEWSTRFFKYEMSRNSIKLFALDERVDIERWLHGAKYHNRHNPDHVLNVFPDDNCVEYSFDNRFYFGGFLFYQIAN